MKQVMENYALNALSRCNLDRCTNLACYLKRRRLLHKNENQNWIFIHLSVFIQLHSSMEINEGVIKNLFIQRLALKGTLQMPFTSLF